ncbi:vomeromodulin-like [Myotis daubentonii]|uniref:vomeromodulin-like n=1 Tax=Myotis daubentonii TaxID=98922 RepID=UPI0028736AFB|nr:vomeromodulin-like [Myotis daubentonii]
MLTLWALAITLAVQAETLDLLAPPTLLGKLPVERPLLLPGQFGRSPPTPNGSSSVKNLLGTSNPGCIPVAKYFMSSSKLNDYLNTTLPPQIEKMLMCADVDLAGVLGTVLDTVSNLDVLSLLDLSSSLNILGDSGLTGVLGKGSNSKSSKSPLPSLSKATDAVSNLLPLAQGALSGLLPNTVAREPAKKADQDSSLLSNLPLPLPLPLGGVLNKVGELKESAEGVLKSAVPSGIDDALSGVLGNINVKDLLIGLEVQKATVENMMLTVTDDEILVQAVTTAFIGGKGLLGPVISILGFQINGDVTLKIGVNTNDTQCVSLQVQDTVIKATKVYLQLVKTVTDTLPLPVPLPLDDVIPQLLTVAMKEKMKESTSCDIDLGDFRECKKSTGLFEYQLKSFQLSEEGLSTLYCASFNRKVLLPGSPLSPNPKNANISITMSNIMLREIITLSAKQSSIQMNNLNTYITRVFYASLPDNQVQAIFWVNVDKDGESFAQGQTKILVSYDCKILNGKLVSDIKIVRFEHSMKPPEAMDELRDVMSAVMKKFISTISEVSSQWNIPPEIASNLLNNAKAELLKSRRWSINEGCSFPSDSPSNSRRSGSFRKRSPINTDPSTLGKISATKMLTLLALAITLAVQAQALDLLTPPSVLGELPVKRPLPLPIQFRRLLPAPNGSPPTRRLAETPPVVKNIMSSSKLYDYLNTTLPPQIEKMLMCADVDLAGVLGTVLDTVSNLDVLSLLDLSSSLSILGDSGLTGVLGKGSNSKSSKSPLPSLSKATDAVSNLLPLAQGALSGLLPNTVAREPAKRADQDSSLLSNLPLPLPRPLGGVLNKVGELKESTEGVLKSAVPSGINDALSGVLGNINVKDLLIGLEVQKATVENMMLTMTDDEILVQAVTTSFIGGKG